MMRMIETGKTATRKHLAEVAGKAAQIHFHGYIEGKESNLEPIIRFFPKWTLREADGLWCAAFVYYCCREAGFEIPIRPDYIGKNIPTSHQEKIAVVTDAAAEEDCGVFIVDREE